MIYSYMGCSFSCLVSTENPQCGPCIKLPCIKLPCTQSSLTSSFLKRPRSKCFTPVFEDTSGDSHMI